MLAATGLGLVGDLGHVAALQAVGQSRRSDPSLTATVVEAVSRIQHRSGSDRPASPTAPEGDIPQMTEIG